MIRIFVFKDRTDENGRVIVLKNNFEDLINTVKKHFCLEDENVKLYTTNGCEILDLDAIRDNEKFYIINDRKDDQNREYVNSVSDWIMLNVGGKHFMTSRSTLTSKFPCSMLARMFADNNDIYLMKPSAVDPNGAFLIDRSPEYFEPILNYMRHGQVILDTNVNPRGVLEEALYYGIDSMIPQLQELVDKMEATSLKSVALTRMDVVRSIIVTDTGCELRFQGVNLSGADLSRLDLRHINFKYANMSKCNLSGANLSNCCLERADLSHAILEGAQLVGVKALCANMEGAYMKSCNMEDPAGNRAVMEGVNLKGANLEGSNMAGVNMRVATLKNANLQNCDLRSAVLAGADLECCDLSGSDLHEANLRGANLKDAAFELMLTPLHMSQTVR